MRFRVLLCIALIMLAACGTALAGTATIDGTVYVYPGQPREAASLTLTVQGTAYDPDTYEPIEVPALAGAVFGVYAKDARGEYVPYPDPANPLAPLTITTGDAAVSVELPRAVDLYLRQEAAPEGYIVTDDEYHALSLPQALAFTNRMSGMQGVSLTLSGVGGAQEMPLAGVGFTLTGEGAAHQLTTDAQGRAALFGIDEGEYILAQTDVPDGYHADTPEIQVMVHAHEPVQIAVQNSLNGTLVLRTLGLALDDTRTARLVPVTRAYEVLDADGNALGTLPNGERLSLPAAVGGVAYTLRAADAPADGYSEDTQTWQVTLFPGQTAMCQTVVRSEKGYFRLAHISAEDGAAVPGGAFVLADAKGDEVLTFEADASGVYEAASPLPQGTYTLSMTHAADGHLFTEAPIAIDITPYLDGQQAVTEATFVSEPVPAALLAPEVTVEAQALESLFNAPADFTFTFAVFGGEPPLPISGLSYSYQVAEVPGGMEVLDESGESVRVRIASRFALEGVPEVTEVTVSGIVRYAFSYRVDADGTKREERVEAPFEATVATFKPRARSAAYAASGHVYDADGALLSGHKIRLVDGKGAVTEEIETDAFGAYAFEKVPARAEIDYNPPKGFGARVEDGGDARILPLRTVTGKVIAEGGLSGYPVQVTIDGGEPIALAADGSFAVTDTFDPDAQVSAEAEDGALVRVENDGDTATVWLYKVASVAGTAKNPEGEAIEGVVVALSGEGVSHKARTDAYGKYTFDGLYPGSYKITFEAPSGYVLNGEKGTAVEIAAGEAARGVDCGAMKPASIIGTLWDGDAPYEGIAVTLMPGWQETVTDADGAFAFEGLPVGAYTLDVAAPEGTIILDMPGEIALTGSAQREARDIHTVRPAGLAGRTWMDTNDDGLQTFDEEGLAGVTIALQDASEATVDTIVTGADGAFAFDGLTPGRYRLAVTLPENMIFAREAPGAERVVVGVDAAEGVSSWYTLASGEHLDALVAGAIIPGGIDGIAWSDLDGDGLMGEGEQGLAGVEIALLQDDEVQQTLTTGEDGAYQFAPLRAGDYTLRITLPEGSMFTAQAPAEATGVGSRVPTSAQRAAEYKVDLRRWRPDATVYIGAQRAASLSAHVWFDTDASGVNPGGAGYAALEVSLYAVGDRGETFVSRQETDASGDVAFEHVRPGAYVLRYALPEATGWGFTTGVAKTAENTGTSATIRLADGEREPVAAVGVTKLGRVAGVLFEDADYDGLRGEQEGGITGTVALLDATGAAIRETQTRAGGAYAFEGIPAGRYIVRFTLPNGYAFTRERAEAPSHNSDVSQTLEPSSQTEVLHLPMGEALLIDAGAYRRASITGTAWQDVSGNGAYMSANPPLAGIEVALLSGDEAVATAVTDAEGKYRFGDLPPGEYIVSATLPEGMRFSGASRQGGRMSLIEETDELTGQMPALRLRNGEAKVERDIGAVYTGTVVGRAIDHKSGGGLAGVAVTLLRDNTVEGETVTDEGGAFRFEEARPGQVEVLFAAPEHWIISEEETNPVRVQVPQGAESTPAGISCIPEATIDGIIWLDGNANGGRDTDEIPLADAKVQLFQQIGEEQVFMADGQTDEEGRYHFDLLLPGDYALLFEPATDVVFYGGDTIAPITLAIGQAREDAVRAYIAATVTGGVWEDLDNNGLWDDGEPGLAGVEMALVLEDGTVAMTAETDEEGAYAFVDVPPMTCAVRVMLPQAYMLTAPADGGSVMPETDGNVAQTELMAIEMGDEIADVSVGALRHTRIGDLVWLDANANGLQDSSETGIPGLKVTLLRPDGETPLAQVETDQNGRYRFDAVRPGQYRVAFAIDAQQYLPTIGNPGLDQLNSKLPWVQGELLTTEVFTAQSGRYQLTIDAGLVPLELAAQLGWAVAEDRTITEP